MQTQTKLICGYDQNIKCVVCEKGMDETSLVILERERVQKIVCSECLFDAVCKSTNS